MFDKAKAALLKKLLKKIYPDRNYDVMPLGKSFVIIKDSVGCNDYVLKGTYTYDQVMKLNEMTGFSAGFGYCKELGPVAFIGVPNYKCVQKSGYFEHKVQEYGDPIDNEEYYFEQYPDDVAKTIQNYTVYGMRDPRVLQNVAPIAKVDHFYDYRYQRKDEWKKDTFHSDVLDMDMRLEGTYGFYEARKLAYGSTGEFTGASGEDAPIQFAIVDEKYPVGIINLWKHYNNAMFRDVWGYGESEPELQSIRFLSDEEACEITDYKLFYYCPTHSFGKKQFVVEKKDRMFDKRYDFHMDDFDYRLLVPEEKKEKVKTLQNEESNH